MGTVVQFSIRSSRPSKPAPNRPCSITIFPGVRYDRRPYVPAPSVSAREIGHAKEQALTGSDVGQG